MSGGSCDYICYRIEETLVGKMNDPVMDELVKDFVGVAHDLEWWQSDDYSENTYRKTVEDFKAKWFTRTGLSEVVKKILADRVNEDLLMLSRLKEVE